MSLLPDALDPADYQVTVSLRDIQSWRARIKLGNSMSAEQNVGDWDEVGVVMVAIKGPNQVIPVARGDEHQRGYDLLHSYRKRWKVRLGDFFPIFTGNTGVFLYSSEDVAPALEAIRRWHGLDGPDVRVRMTDALDRKNRWIVNSRDFLQGSGSPIPGPDGILPIGQRFIDHLRAVQAALADLRSDANPAVFHPGNRRHLAQLGNTARRLGDFLAENGEIGFEVFYEHRTHKFRGGETYEEALAVWRARLEQAILEADVASIEAMVFAHNGVKNLVHMAIRQEMRSRWGADHMTDTFGDLELANDVLGRISPGLDEEMKSEASSTAPGIP